MWSAVSERRRPQDEHIRWAAQAVTFYLPQYWGRTSTADLAAWVGDNPLTFWNKLLDDVMSCGMDFLELCFFPGDWTSLRAAYHTPAGVRAALAARGLQLGGSYQGGGHSLEDVVMDRAAEHDFIERLAEHAEFVRLCGGTTVLTGPPRRFQLTGSYTEPVSDDLLSRLSRVLDACGRAAAEQGVRFGVHTEAYSCMCRPSEIDRVMRATDDSLVGLCVDTGHVVLDGADPVEVIRGHGNRVRSVHWKDCTGERAWLPEDGEVSHEMMMEQFRRAGSGVVDWHSVVTALREAAFSGFAAVEIDLVADPVGDTRAVLDFFDTQFAREYR